MGAELSMITPESMVWLQLGQLLMTPVLYEGDDIVLPPQLLHPDDMTGLLPQLLQP